MPGQELSSYVRWSTPLPEGSGAYISAAGIALRHNSASVKKREHPTLGAWLQLATGYAVYKAGKRQVEYAEWHRRFRPSFSMTSTVARPRGRSASPWTARNT